MFDSQCKAASRACAAALLLSLAASSAALAADEKPYVMKISLATVGDPLHEFAKSYAAAVAKDSNGRIKVEIYPSSQLGSTQRQIEGVQFGEIQALVVPPEFLSGLDERFEILAAPGLVTSIAGGQRLAADPAVQKLMLGLGADKGLHGSALFLAAPSAVVARMPIRRLAEFKGKKIRVFASQFQSVAVQRLGAIPKPMTLGDVLPALQDNAIDAAVSSITVFTTMRYWDAAKYVTETGQPAIFGLAELSKKWFDSLPPDLQQVLDKDAAAQVAALAPRTEEFNADARKIWTEHGGELIRLPPDDQSAMLKALASVGEDVAKARPQLNAAYQTVMEAAQRSQ
ncbi:MAG TPA: TRAP transporter substrate-binding protein [Xanthobacteraceae bacterium]|nr:TRAP transporter substrate-binding protein [Xanthobacteraceae bacterium]